MLFASPLLALALLTQPAAAKEVLLDLEPGVLDAVRAGPSGAVYVTVHDDGVTLGGVDIDVTGESGGESIELVEVDAWLHGAASLAELPADGAALTLTIYGVDGAALATFTSSATANTGPGGNPWIFVAEASTCAKGEVCTDPDVEVLAAALFPTADGGYALSFDLAGADVPDVAYADVAVLAPYAPSEPSTCTTKGCPDSTVRKGDLSCSIEDKSGTCLEMKDGVDAYACLDWTDDGDCTVVDDGGTTAIGGYWWCYDMADDGICNVWWWIDDDQTSPIDWESTGMTVAEVDFDALGSVWEGRTSVDDTGGLEIDVRTYDHDGKTLDKGTVNLGAPWDDGGAGVNALAAGDGTSLAVDPRPSYCEHGKYFGEDCSKSGGGCSREECWDVFTSFDVDDSEALVVVSTSWTRDEAPQLAELAIDGGATITIPANSYQVATYAPITFAGSPEKEQFQLTVDGEVLKEGSDWTNRGFCSYGRCFALAQDEAGAWTLSATAYAPTAADLPQKMVVTLTSTLKAAETKERSYTLSFADDVTVVFANEVSFAEDPIGLDLSGEVTLLGAADKKGKQKTISKADFSASYTRDADGDLSLGGIDRNDVARAECDACDILIGWEPIEVEKTDTNGDGVIDRPPAIQLRNGTGTRNTATNTSQSQQAQLL